MPYPKVVINVTNGGLGSTTQTSDGVVGLVLQGVAASGLAIATSKQIFSLKEAEGLGITALYDSTNNVKAWQQIKEFYAEAGTGAELWIMLLSQALSLQTICDKAQAYAKKLIDDANGRIKVVAIARNPASGYVPVTTGGIDADVIAALTTAQALAEEEAAGFTPVRFILPGHAYQGNTTTLTDLKSQTKNRVAVLIGGTSSGMVSTGLVLGRVAKIPVQRSIGRVKDGALAIVSAFLGTALLEGILSNSESLHNKGYITLRKIPSKAGYYFTSDPTAIADSDDYSSLKNGRVIDKALAITAEVFLNQILDEISLDASGKLHLAIVKADERSILTALETQMVDNDNISSAKCYINPSQNILATGIYNVELRIVPVGYKEQIIINLGFQNPA
jgi:Protein of unknown function (DUF2586)